ncbi:LOW QUALITY PROTEIN: SHC-transforming protein 3 [Boleophthalmus pectinirostris]|uniref:LOW QUALITY PROTEIN: SHC-transforming protein 3 n=1 Tax=Boleophthalmus pectinirostris TaxID=150288 RepID=UPI00242B236C|nr:LOW QUALITY PROTEIN: SHC-transforming protein 3 [Boleophthalmus pectinirostris]
MRKDTLFKSPTGLLPGMLKRTKYSRLRNDTLPSLEDRPIRVLPLKRNLCLDQDLSPLPSVPSTLRDFMANIRIQSPLRDRTGPPKPVTVPGHGDRTEQRLFNQTSLDRAESLSQRCTKRPITLHRMASLPWTPGCVPCDHHRLKCCWDRAYSEKAGVKTAIHHDIKYMGSVEVTQSMRTLDFRTRMQVTREAISRLCEKSSTKTSVKSKKVQTGHKGLCVVLGQSDLSFSRSRVILSVSTESLSLLCVSSLQKIAHHSMQSISFASGADPDMADYIAYVAKDQDNRRACHILECPQGRAVEVINSIGQAFEARFHQMLSQSSPLLSHSRRSVDIPRSHSHTDQRLEPGMDYYNMVPKETPPAVGTEELHISERDKTPDQIVQRVCPSPPGTLYENCSTSEQTAPPEESSEAGAVCQIKDSRIQDEDWFHGRLDREQAESLLSSSGDFLVRESSSASGQYVLSGREGATVRHLLLVDPNGQVRTRDKVFLSIGHLIQFYMESQMPIQSGTSELCLKQPILLKH